MGMSAIKNLTRIRSFLSQSYLYYEKVMVIRGQGYGKGKQARCAFVVVVALVLLAHHDDIYISSLSRYHSHGFILIDLAFVVSSIVLKY